MFFISKRKLASERCHDVVGGGWVKVYGVANIGGTTTDGCRLMEGDHMCRRRGWVRYSRCRYGEKVGIRWDVAFGGGFVCLRGEV